MTSLDQIDTALCRLKESALHDPSEEVYVSATSTMLVPTLHPQDELGRSALAHYCADLETATKKLSRLYQCPAGVSDEAVSWVCKTIKTYKSESAFVKFAAEALQRFCTPALMYEASLRSADVGKKIEPTVEEQAEATRKARHRCKILHQHAMFDFIRELISSTDIHAKTDFTRGLLACIQAVCADPAGAAELSMIPGIIETVHTVVQDNLKLDTELMVEAVRTLGVLTSEASLDTIAACGAVTTIIHLLQYRGEQKTLVITATAQTIEPLCHYMVTCRMVLEANGVYYLLRAVGPVRDTIAATSVLYRCLRMLCAKVDDCARQLRQHNGLQVLVTSISSIAHAEELNTPVLVDLLDCVAIVCETAQASGTLIYSGQTLLFEIVQKHSSNEEVLIAATNVILICMRDTEAKKLITMLSFNIAVETMVRFENRPAIVTIVCDVLNMLSDNPELCSMLAKAPSQCLVRIARQYRRDAKLCAILATCCVNLATQIRDTVLHQFLPPLIEGALANPEDVYLQGCLAKLMITVSRCEPDRILIEKWGGLDIVMARAVQDTAPERDELTLRSFLLFILTPDLKRALVQRGAIDVLCRIRRNIEALGSYSEQAPLWSLLVELLQSLIVDEAAEEAILKTGLHEALLDPPPEAAPPLRMGRVDTSALSPSG